MDGPARVGIMNFSVPILRDRGSIPRREASSDPLTIIPPRGRVILKTMRMILEVIYVRRTLLLAQIPNGSVTRHPFLFYSHRGERDDDGNIYVPIDSHRRLIGTGDYRLIRAGD